jgi:hypothetical protein
MPKSYFQIAKDLFVNNNHDIKDGWLSLPTLTLRQSWFDNIRVFITKKQSFFIFRSFVLNQDSFDRSSYLELFQTLDFSFPENDRQLILFWTSSGNWNSSTTKTFRETNCFNRYIE